MRTLKMGVVQAVFLALLLGYFNGVACAQAEPTPWFDHLYGSAEVVAYSHKGEEEQLLFDGFLRFNYPYQFQVAYGTPSGLVIITSFNDFLELQTKGEFQYGYDQHWLVKYFESYIFRLLEFSQRPLEFSGSTQIADRDVFRYTDQEDPELVYWLDQQTKVPLLIRQGKETLLTVEAYSLQASSGEVELELTLFFPPQPAKMTLSLGPEGWMPIRLEISEPAEHIMIEFSSWNFEYNWVPESSASKLGDLKDLHERFFAEFEEKRWSDALLTCQQMLALAPQFWQVYLYQAFVYEGLGNFLGAVENYQQVLMREPHNALALNNLAYHYLLREVQISQALELAEQAVALERKYAYLDTLGYAYYLVGRYEEALTLLEEALEGADPEAAEEVAAHMDLVLQALERERD